MSARNRSISGSFESHLTVWPYQAEALEAFAAEHGLKFLRIELDRGLQPSQPMLTWRGEGTFEEQRTVAQDWSTRLQAARIVPVRVKIEATPWSAGVPEADADAEPGRYFEHHIKLLLPATTRLADLLALTALAEPHGARLSRNARRQLANGAGGQERFVNQRCHDAGRATATERLDRLVADLRAAGHEVVSVEQEYVVQDSNLALDRGWLEAVDVEVPSSRHVWSASQRYPDTFRPLPPGWGATQSAAFDPALKQHPNAYRAGEPEFDDESVGRRWRTARRAAMNHLLTALGTSRWAGHLVLRGSVTMPAWVGVAAREPGDLDFVVDPPTVTSDSPEARELLDGIPAAVMATPGAGLRPERTAESAIWTYERADGRRLVIPFEVAGGPDGIVQIDIVFGEHLPLPPEPVVLPGVATPVPAATAALSLAWKLLWLAGDSYPQGKDLYDAVLLAEHTTVELTVVRELLRTELGREAETFTADTVLTWSDIDWENFTDEYPGVEGTDRDWLLRLAMALDRGWA